MKGAGNISVTVGVQSGSIQGRELSCCSALYGRYS